MHAKGQLISEGNFGVIPATSIKPKPQSARKEAREAGFLVLHITIRPLDS